MRSVTEQLTGDAPPSAPTPEPAPEDHTKLAEAKLRVAYATRNPHAAARPTGVKLLSPGHEQVQEIFDDGSARNPYKRNREMSGRQRRKLRQQANRTMRARGIPATLSDVLKGRRMGTPERPQPATPAPAVEANPVGIPVADIVSD